VICPSKISGGLIEAFDFVQKKLFMREWEKWDSQEDE